MTKKIKILADYNGSPIWDASGTSFGCIDPEEFPISDQLISDLWEWQGRFDATYDDANPAESNFKSSEDYESFLSTAQQLVVRLKNELGDDYTVEEFER